MRERKERKSKGTLSVLDEFTSDAGAGEIVFTSKANPEVLKKIEEATRLADIPISSRASKDASSDFEFNDSYSPMGTLAKKIQSDDQQTDNKQITFHEPKLSKSENISHSEYSSNIVQTSAKPSSEYSSNIVQTSAKPSSNNDVSDVETNETWFKPSSKPGANIVQTSAKPSSNIVQKFDFHMLSPTQQKLIFFLYNESQLSRSKISSPLNGAILANHLESSLEGLRTAVKRLVKMGFLYIPEVKNGRTGWTKYQLPEDVYQQVVLNEKWFKPSSNIVQTSAKPSSEPSSEPSSNPSYSSSNDLNINTITTELPENLRRFGISTVNLQKLVTSGKTTQDIVERSLAALSFDVENGKTGNLANILFGVLGSGREYISQKYSESLQVELDQELARMAEAEENQKQIAELRLKAKFHAYAQANPQFFESVKDRNKGYIKTQELLEKVAFEEFKLGLGVESV